MQVFCQGLRPLLRSLILLPCAVAAADTTALSTGSRPDQELLRFVQSAVDANPQVQAARAALNATRADREAASQPLYNPQLSIGAENADSETRAIGISQTLDWGRKREARTAVAESDRWVAEAAYLSVRWTITVNLLDGLASHQTGTDRERLADIRRGLMEDFALLARRRFEAGDLNQVELSLAQLAYTDARIQSATARAALAEARQSVHALTTYSSPERWPVLPSNMLPLPSSAQDTQAMVSQLPEVMVARHQADSASALVDLRKRERRPDPTITVAAGREDSENLVGIDLSIPLFVRNRFSHEVAAAAARHTEAQQVSNDVTLRAHARLISAAERYQLSLDAWDDWQQAGQASLANQTEQLEKLWQAGEISTTDYLVQLTATLDVQESALDLQEALWRAWFEWLSASGRVDSWLSQGHAQ